MNNVSRNRRRLLAAERYRVRTQQDKLVPIWDLWYSHRLRRPLPQTGVIMYRLAHRACRLQLCDDHRYIEKMRRRSVDQTSCSWSLGAPCGGCWSCQHAQVSYYILERWGPIMSYALDVIGDRNLAKYQRRQR